MLDWIISEQVIKGTNREYTVDRLPKERKLMLAFNIFPGGQTLFHKLFRHIIFFKAKRGSKYKYIAGKDTYILQNMETSAEILMK